MTTLLLHRPLFARATAALGLSGAAFSLHSHYQHRNPLRLDASSSSTPGPASNPADWSFSQYQRDAHAPVVNKRGGLNPAAVRQMTWGSILGLATGLSVSLFSKPLAVILGLAFLGLHTAERQLGVRLVPYERISKLAKGWDLRGLVQDDAALKVSFGVMFALSGFASF